MSPTEKLVEALEDCRRAIDMTGSSVANWRLMHEQASAKASAALSAIPYPSEEEIAGILQPFADAAKDADERGGVDDYSCPDDYPINDASDQVITLGHCRAVRAILKRMKEE